MNPNPDPIVIVEDNAEDCRFLTEALKIIGVNNSLKCFDSATNAFKYLKTASEKTLVIICDVNMPFMTGIEFKKAINSDKELYKKNIPFIFLSTLSPEVYVSEVSKLFVQGHFKKPARFDELIHIVRSIIESCNRAHSISGN